MWFLSSAMLGGLAALLAPIILHLWQRRRVVQMPFGSLRFLKKVAARTSRLSRFENLLLLLLRCLLLALLVLAAARPVISARAARMFGGNAPRTVVLIVDNSASMALRAGERTRLETAKAQAAVIAADLRPADGIALIAADDRAQLLIAEPTLDHAVALRTIDTITQSQARGDLGTALRSARRLAARAGGSACQVFVLTDGQSNAWRFDPASVFDDVWRAARIELVVVHPDGLVPGNAGITGVKWDQSLLGTETLARGRVTVENASESPLHDVLEITLGGQRVAQNAFDVPARDAVEVPVEIARTLPGTERWSAGEMKLSGDHYPLDDRYFFALPNAQPARVLLVGDPVSGAGNLPPTFFLEKALAAGASASSRPAATVSTAGALETTDLTPFTAIFLADPGRVGDRAVVRIDRWLETGGIVVFFPGDLSVAAGTENLDFLPARALPPLDLPTGRLSTAIADPGDPLFANTWDAGSPFPALSLRCALGWQPAKEARVLATVGPNIPFIIAGNRAAGRVLIVNATADRAWGDLPLSPAFLPLVQQLAGAANARSSAAKSFPVGALVPWPAGFPSEAAATLTLPDGTRRELPAGEKLSLLERGEQPGNYQVSAGPEAVPFSVNVDPSEGSFAPAPTAALDKAAPHTTLTGGEELRDWLGNSRGFVPLWPYLLGAAALVFLIEGIFSNVTAGRRSQGHSAGIRTGRLNQRRAGTPFRTETASTGAGTAV